MIDGISRNYSSKNRIIEHFYSKGDTLPLWAYFEIITLGELGNFISALDQSSRLKITKALNVYFLEVDQNGRMLELIISTLVNLRNYVMHNSVIFDCRFSKDNVGSKLIQYISKLTNKEKNDFTSIIDYFILVIFILKNQGYTKTELRQSIKSLEAEIDTLRRKSQKYISMRSSKIATREN